MIKRSDRSSQTSLKLLKVLDTKDYLAIDHTLNYHILAPIHSKIDKNIVQLKTQIHTFSKMEHHIIEPKEIINMDGIMYYVMFVGRNEAVWVRNVERDKIRNGNFQLRMLEGAVRCILKVLVQFKWSQIKFYLNVHNFVVIRGLLYFLFLPRNKYHHFGLKRSEKSPEKDENKMQQKVKNQQRIVKQFGLILLQIFESGIKEERQASLNVVDRLIKEMIHKQINTEYLQMKLAKIRGRIRRTPKIHLFNHRLQTQQTLYESNYRSLERDKRQNRQTEVKQRLSPNTFISRRLFSIRNNSSAQSYYRQSSMHRKNTSQKSKFSIFGQENQFKEGKRSYFKKVLQKNQIEREKYKKYLDRYDFDLSFKEKVKRQGEIARQKFRKSIQKDAKEQKTQFDSKAANLKLIKRLKKMKSEQQRKQKISAKQLYESIRRVNNEGANIERKLQYSDLKESTSEINAQIQQQKIVSSDKIKEEYLESNIEMTHPSIIGHQNINKSEQKIDKSSPIQVIKQSQIDEVDNIVYSQVASKKNDDRGLNEQVKDEVHIQSKEGIKNTFSKIPDIANMIIEDGILVQKQNSVIMKKGKQIDKKFEEKTIEQKPNETKIKKPTAINELAIDQDEDQIEQVKLGWNKIKQTSTPSNNNYIKQSPRPESVSNNQKRQFQGKKIHYDSITESIEEYITMINILGNICVKSVKNRDKLGNLDWRRVVYFIYQRFCYQRQKIVRCLELGVCQVFRRSRKINLSQWQDWLTAVKKTNFMQKMILENVKIREDLQKFASKVPTSKINPKMSSYIKSRERILNTENIKLRMQMSKLTILSMIQFYDSLAGKKISAKELSQFLIDSLFAMKVICELDNMCHGQKSLILNLDDYQVYDWGGKEICELVDQLYLTYLKGDQLEI